MMMVAFLFGLPAPTMTRFAFVAFCEYTVEDLPDRHVKLEKSDAFD
jgi:hypothetical protein